ncbi:unnamed protein product [Closterium sp. Naga37s-1]|nr:unnamed protein product [Closterium sp. Naga37s-1]CAI5531059.1 unnamed protein product [Closterium sp. Naga37s-1]
MRAPSAVPAVPPFAASLCASPPAFSPAAPPPIPMRAPSALPGVRAGGQAERGAAVVGVGGGARAGTALPLHATAAMPLHGCFLPQLSATAGNLPLKVACSSQAQGAAAAGLLALRVGLQQPCVSKAAVSEARWCARTCRGFFRNACRNHPHCQQYPSWLCRMCVVATASSATTATTAPTALLHCHLTCCHAVPHPPCLFISSPSTMPFHFLPIHHATMPCCALSPIHYLPSHPSKSLPSRHFPPCNPLLAMLHATPPHWLQCWPSSLSPPPSPSLPSPRLFHLSPQAGRILPQAGHVTPFPRNMGTPPHPPLVTRTADAELARADVATADVARVWLEGVFADLKDEPVWSASIARHPPSPALPLRSPLPSSLAHPLLLLLTSSPLLHCHSLYQHQHNPLHRSHSIPSQLPCLPFPRPQLPSSTVLSFIVPLRLLPFSCGLNAMPPATTGATLGTAPGCWVGGRSGRAWWGADSKGVDKEE